MELKKVVQIKSGKRMPKGSFLSNIKNAHPYIKVKDMQDYKTKLNDNFEYVPDDIFPKISKYIVNTGNVILSIVGTIGNVSIIDKTLNNASLTENCVKLIPNDTLLSEYLYYFLISPKGKAEIEKGIIGSTQPKLPFYNIEQINIPLVNKEHQQHIVNIIGSIDDLIEQYNSSINKLWDLITLKYSKSFPNIHNLKGVNVITLNDVCDRFATGLNPRNNFKLGYGTNYYVTIKNFETGNLFLNDKCDKVDDDALLKINNRSDLQKGDILFSGIGTIGRTYLIPETPVNWNISESVFSIRPSKEISSEFLYLLLTDQDMQSYSHDNASGSVQKGIRMADIKAYKFNLPSKEEIFNFTNNVINLFNKIENFKKQITYLTNLKKNYLKKFFG